MSVRVVSVASRCIILFPSPANTPSRQHQFGADQHSFCSPALSRCQPSLLSCQHFYYFMCSEPTASVPPLLVDANLPCFRANTSTTSCAACLRLQYAPSVSVRLEYLHTPLHCSAIESTRCYLRFIIAGRTSFNQFSASSMFSYVWPAPGDGDGDMRVHMQPDAAVLRSSASRVVR